MNGKLHGGILVGKSPKKVRVSADLDEETKQMQICLSMPSKTLLENDKNNNQDLVKEVDQHKVDKGLRKNPSNLAS